MLVEGHYIDPALLDARKTARAVGSVFDGKTLPLQAALDQPRKTSVVVNVQEKRGCRFHALTGGTWMTEKKRPNCRMALAKLS
jgi:hypothetical protein